MPGSPGRLGRPSALFQRDMAESIRQVRANSPTVLVDVSGLDLVDSRDLDGENGDVVLEMLVPSPGDDLPDHRIHAFGQRRVAAVSDGGQQASVAELLPCGVHFLGHTVGMNVKAVTRQ